MKTKRYDHHLRTFPGVGSDDRNFYQPIATGLASVRGVVSQPSTTGSGSSNPLGGKDNEPLASTRQVRPLIATPITHPHGFRQLSTQVIVKDIQVAEQSISHVKSISGPAESTVIAIGSANTAVGQIDSISSTYLQPLSIFNAVVTGIANVRPLKHLWSNFNLRSCIGPPIRPNGIICVDNGIQGIYQSGVMLSTNGFINSSFCRKRIWTPASQSSLPESNEPTSLSWKTGRRPRSTQRKMC